MPLRAYEDEHSELCDLIPSEDQFYGFSKGSNRPARYVQWVSTGGQGCN